MLMASVFVQGPLAKDSEGNGNDFDREAAYASADESDDAGESAEDGIHDLAAIARAESRAETGNIGEGADTQAISTNAPSLEYTRSIDAAIAGDETTRQQESTQRTATLDRQRKAAMRRAAADGYSKGTDSFAYGGPPERPGTGYVDVHRLK